MKLSPTYSLSGRALASLTAGAVALILAVPAFADDAGADKPAAAPDDGHKGHHGAKGALKGLKHSLKAKDGSGKKGHSGDKDKPGHEKKGHGPGKKGSAPKVDRKEALDAYRAAVQALAAADADGAEGTAAEKKAAVEAMKDAKKDLRIAHRESAKALLAMKKSDADSLKAKLQARVTQLRADRKDRTEKHRETLKKEWGDKVKNARVHAELARHAWRVARLERLIAIAEATGREGSATRGQEILKKEHAALPARLKKAAESGSAEPVKADGAAPAAPAAAASVAPTTPKAAPATPAPKPAAPAAAPKTNGGAQ